MFDKVGIYDGTYNTNLLRTQRKNKLIFKILF